MEEKDRLGLVAIEISLPCEIHWGYYYMKLFLEHQLIDRAFGLLPPNLRCYALLHQSSPPLLNTFQHLAVAL